MANRNWASGGKIYSMHKEPVLLDCNFVVDSTNGNGLGIRSLKGPAIQNIFMHTSATPGAGNSNPASPNVIVTNPNPGTGIIVVQLQDNYNRSFSGFNSIVSPVSGTPISISAGLTIGQAYVIISLGTSTAANFQALGLGAGIVPAPGVAFIATSASAGVGTGIVEVSATAGSGIMSIETIGDPNQTLHPIPTANQGYGGQIILECRNASGVAVAPAAGTVISLSFYLSNSSVLVQGE